MKTSYEVIILGLGGIGSGAAYWLGRRYGRDVLGLEQFEIGHVRGGSQDHSRIIRLSYHTPAYVALAQQAYQAWATLEADAAEALILKTGGLDFFPANAAIPSSDYTNSLTACDVTFEWLTAAEVRYRWSQFHLADDVQAIYQAESGIAPPPDVMRRIYAWLKRMGSYCRMMKRSRPYTTAAPKLPSSPTGPGINAATCSSPAARGAMRRWPISAGGCR